MGINGRPKSRPFLFHETRDKYYLLFFFAVFLRTGPFEICSRNARHCGHAIASGYIHKADATGGAARLFNIFDFSAQHHATGRDNGHLVGVLHHTNGSDGSNGGQRFHIDGEHPAGAAGDLPGFFYLGGARM